jgi:hypothetical protein
MRLACRVVHVLLWHRQRSASELMRSSPSSAAPAIFPNRPFPDARLERRKRLVGAFLAAARRGDVTSLLCLLDPDAVLRADRSTMWAGTSKETRDPPP